MAKQDTDSDRKKNSKADGKKEVVVEKISFIGKVMRLLIFVVCLGFIAVIYYMAQPQDVTDIDGRDPSVSPPRDLQEVLTKAVEGRYSVMITEAEINQMLHRKLVAKQGGLLEGNAVIKSVLVRLKPDIAEVILVRDVFGREVTVSMYLQIEQVESQSGISTQIHLHGADLQSTSRVPKKGGRFGQLTVPQGFLVVVMPDFIKIADALSTEIELGFEKMTRFKIDDKRITLDPNRPTRHIGAEDTPF